LHGDTYAVTRLVRRTIYRITRAQRLADGAQILVLALKLEGGGAPDDAQIPHLGKRGGDLVGYSVGEKLLRRIADRFTKKRTQVSRLQ